MIGMNPNHQNLIRSFQYLQNLIDQRLKHHLFKKKTTKNAPALKTFQVLAGEDVYTRFLIHCELSMEEFIVLIGALVPHVIPNFYERILAQHMPQGGDFPEFGGYREGNARYMMPTVSTMLFILAGDDISRRIELLELFDGGHFLAKEQIIHVDEGQVGDPFLSRRILIDEEYVELFTKGYISTPALSSSFPAEEISTEMDWEDLILNPSTANRLQEIELWLQHNDSVMEDWGLKKRVKAGYRALFFGPPGTGKTLAASLIGKSADRPVFRVDLSKVVSKYIGETEKNLAHLFDKAENKDWILFFDEADACFGKRSATKDSKDRYANQEIAYLLQRIENYNGLVILATNFKNNIDEAFLRRFNAVIYFPKPKSDERLKLWQNTIPKQVELSQDVDLPSIAQKYELTGAHIVGAIHYACIRTRSIGAERIPADFILKGINRELAKEGKRA